MSLAVLGISHWIMKKVTPKKTKKSPWVPPPGRTRHCDTVSAKTQSTLAPDTTLDLKNIEDDTFDLTSLCSTSSSVKFPNDKNVHLCSIKEEIKLLTIHFMSLKRVSLFLNRYFITHKVENLTIKDLHERIDESVKDIIFELDDLEYAVAVVENTLNSENNAEEYLKMVNIEQNLLSKLLDSYSRAVTIFESVLQTQNAEDVTRIPQSREVLQTQLQNSEKKCVSQSAMIKDFQRRLSLLQGKTNTVESYKSTLEETRTELEKQLAYKEAQIKYLSAELSKLSSRHHDSGNNEELLEIIEKIKKNSQAEKTALKKALKLQKSRTENAKETIEKLTRDLKERDKMMFSLASQRDQLKLQLTFAKNDSIEGKTQKQGIEIQNMRLYEELREKQSDFKTQLREMENSLKEKTAQLNEATQDKVNLQRELDDTKNTLHITANKLTTLECNYSNVKEFLSQTSGDGNQRNALDEVKLLITLLQDTKDRFNNYRTTSIYNTAIEDENISNICNTDYTQKNVLTAVEEIKEHLLQLKDICDNSNKQNGNIDLEGKLRDLQKAYDECSKQNDSLKSELKELKASKIPNMHMSANDNISTYIAENDFSTKSLQMELRLKTEENCRIKQREKELERQLEEVKEKLHRKEIENNRLHSVEEELEVTRNEMSLLDLKKVEESEKSQRTIVELQESLDKFTKEYEAMKQYVHVLKSSFLNVFREP